MPAGGRDEQFDVIVMGHVAIDVNVSPSGVVEDALGGAPTYAGFALSALRKNVGIVSKVGADFPERFPPIYSKLGLDTEGMFVVGEHTTTFENVYDGAGRRKQRCRHAAPKILPEDVPAVYRGARGFYVSPIAREVDQDLLKSIKREDNLVMFDPQGILREIGEDGEVIVKPRDDLADFLQHVDIVKMGMDEAQVLKGEVKLSLAGLCELGPRIAILTRGPEPCIVFSGGKLVEVPSLKVDAADLTGAGDVFGAAFLARYLDTREVSGSARFAAAAASLKIKYKGPTGFPTEEEILKAMTEGYKVSA